MGYETGSVNPIVTGMPIILLKISFLHWQGDVRVKKDRIVVTYYNAPTRERLKACYMDLPRKLEKENIDPRIPSLYNYKLDSRFY